jgi:hypothetical protein
MTLSARDVNHFVLYGTLPPLAELEPLTCGYATPGGAGNDRDSQAPTDRVRGVAHLGTKLPYGGV